MTKWDYVTLDIEIGVMAVPLSKRKGSLAWYQALGEHVTEKIDSV